MKKIFTTLTIIGYLFVSCSNKTDYQGAKNTEEALEWLNEAKFGMFVHWGLYSIPAGEWKGLQVPYISEWIMKRAEIPAIEYAKLAKEFNPTEFNASEWVKVAKDAGMKYMIVTSKHHDGFAMFESEASDYNIVDASPYAKDPMKELAIACQKHGIKLGFYYSNDQDWHAPNASGNDWDFDPENKDFQKYLEKKVKPQVRELLTNYGPVAVIWFDTPMAINAEQSKDLTDFVHSIQPGCLVNDRVGHGMGDYKGFGDNQVPGGIVNGVWETCGTTNHSWAYKRSDKEWKSPKLLIQLLTNIVSKGGVYLLNVGPDDKGKIPAPAVENLREVGEWLKVNGESIYGAAPSPYQQEFDWGTMTRKRNRLFLQIHHMPANNIKLKGFNSKVSKSYLLSDETKQLNFNQKGGNLTITVNDSVVDKKSFIPIIVLEFEGELMIDNTITNKQNRIITLPAYRANINQAEKSHLENDGSIVKFMPENNQNSITWDFNTEITGKYKIILVVANHHWTGFAKGNEVELIFNQDTHKNKVIDTYRFENLNTLTWQDSPVEIGTITIVQKGKQSLMLKPVKLSASGLSVRRIDLVPIDVNYKEEYQYKIRTPAAPIAEQMAVFYSELEKLEPNEKN